MVVLVLVLRIVSPPRKTLVHGNLGYSHDGSNFRSQQMSRCGNATMIFIVVTIVPQEIPTMANLRRRRRRSTMSDALW